MVPVPERLIWVIDPRASRVDFMLRHLGIGRLVGRFDRFWGTLSTDHEQVLRAFDLTVETDSLDTGDAERDNRVRGARLFGSLDHSAMELRGTWARPIARGRYHVDALLTMHGETHYVELVAGHGTLEPDADGRQLYVARAEGVFDRRQWRVAVHPILEAGRLLLGHDVHVRLTLGALADETAAS